MRRGASRIRLIGEDERLARGLISTGKQWEVALALVRETPGQLTAYYAERLGLGTFCGEVSTVSGILAYAVRKGALVSTTETVPGRPHSLRRRWYPAGS